METDTRKVRGCLEASFGKQRAEKSRRDSRVPSLVPFQKRKELKDAGLFDDTFER